jgi:hypothetical protein
MALLEHMAITRRAMRECTPTCVEEAAFELDGGDARMERCLYDERCTR